MTREKGKKLLTGLLLVSLILRFSFVLGNIHHDCPTEENCPICQEILKLTTDLSNYTPEKILIVLLVFLGTFETILIRRTNNTTPTTLIHLKVRLNN